MRLKNFLSESKVSDVFSDTFIDFISDYNLIYSNSLFVIFTNNDGFSISDLDTDNDTNMPMIFPLRDVVENPSKYTEYAENKNLLVIKPKGRILDITEVSLNQVRELAKVIGVEDGDFETILAHTGKSYKASFPTMETFLFKRLLFNDVRINDGEPEYTQNSDKQITAKLKRLGVSVIAQFENDTYILSKSRKAIAYTISNNMAVKDRYEIYDPSPVEEIEQKEGDNNLYFRDREYMREVAEKVANGLGTSLNADPVYALFLDYYFWTRDGIEIVITVAFGEDNDSSDSDNVHFIVEADTPYGIVVHHIGSDETIDEIPAEIKKVYGAHVVPNDGWEPMNRDIFLDGERKEYKLFDTHYEDINKVVGEFYPIMHEFARRNNIGLPMIGYYGGFDRLFIHQFVDFLASNPTPADQLVKNLEEREADFDDLFFVPMPKKITIDLLKNIAFTYSLMKKRKPNTKGWHLFKEK